MIKIRQLQETLKFGVAYFFSLFLRKREIWLVSERKDECRDNGYHFFLYMRKHFYEKPVYYVIAKGSSDLAKINHLGNVIYEKSFKHFLYYVLADKLIGAHVHCSTPDTPICWKLERKKILNKKKAYLKHGIVKEMLSQHFYQNTQLDLYVCGAKPEFDYVSTHFGYPPSSVQYLGLCRFDHLHNYQTKRQILFFPTWRLWLSEFSKTWGSNHDEQLFMETDYFKQLHAVLTNEKLIMLLEEENYELIFFPHHEMQDFTHLFPKSSRQMIIANEKEYDVQVLLKEAEILITDYSSVAFDFAYMRKPLIYYQFDEKEYYKKHYQKGYYDVKLNGLGMFTDQVDQLVNEVENLIKKTNQETQAVFLQRADAFFPLYDQDNCKRVYEAIERL